jgi:hypothetical protein
MAYEYKIDVATVYLTHLEVEAESQPLCDNIGKHIIGHLTDRTNIRLKQDQNWEIVSHGMTLVGNHLVMSLLFRRPVA